MHLEETTQVPHLDDYYSEPENILKISVCNPITHGEGSARFTDYEIICKTNLPLFKKTSSNVRRRYREFKWLRDLLIRENPNVKIPDIPSQRLFSDKFQDNVILERISGFEKFLKSYHLVLLFSVQFCSICSHPVIQKGPSAKIIVSFLQDPSD